MPKAPLEVLAHHWAFALYIIVAVVLCSGLLFLSRFLGESGLDSVGSARQRFSLKFYLVAMFFVIFDIQALFLFAWSVSVRSVGWVGFASATLFIAVMLTALLYLIRIGALDWTPVRSKRHALEHLAEQSDMNLGMGERK